MQSLRRKMKRGHIMTVFNIQTAMFDFYRRAKNTGLYLRIPADLAHGNTNSFGRGPGISILQLRKMQKEGSEALETRSKYMGSTNQESKTEEASKGGVLKRIFGSK